MVCSIWLLGFRTPILRCYCVCMHPTCIPMVTCVDLPFDLRYLTWAESRGIALCTVAPVCWWGDQLAAWWCGISYVTSWSCAEDVDAVYALEYLQTQTPNDLPKAKPAFKVECPVILCATYILPEASARVQGYWSHYPPHMSLRVWWTWWKASGHSLHHPVLT